MDAERRQADDRYLQVVRAMKTFVCEGCFDEELREHPTLGDDWTAAWFAAMAHLAKELGWLLIEPAEGRAAGFFKGFMILGPACAAARRASE